MESHGESRSKVKKTVYALCALTAAGYLGAYVGRSFGLREQVQEICEQYARRINLTISTNDGSRMKPLDVPALFSRYETFRPSDVSASDKGLDSGVGFKFEYMKNEEEVTEDTFRRPKRTHYTFAVTRDYSRDVCESITISRYDDLEPLSFTIITFCPATGYQSVSAEDRINNTSIELQKESSSSDVEFDPPEMGEAAARKLWDFYFVLFQDFKRQHAIDDRIAQFSPRTEIVYPLEAKP